MKRIISITCAFIMILSIFSIAYAGVKDVQGGNGNNQGQMTEIEKTSQENKMIREDKGLEGDKEIKEEVNALNEQIKQNNQELLNLREELNLVTLDIQSKVKQLFSDKTSITQAEVANLKTVLAIVKNSRKGIRGIKSDGLKQKILDGKVLRENKKLRKAKVYMEKVIELQEKRKLILNDSMSNLDKANKLLSEDK